MDSIGNFFFYFFILCLLAIIPGAIAQKKGDSFFAWWIFGVLLLIVALPLAILLPTKARGRNNPTNACPYCGATLDVSVRKCPACGRSQPVLATSTVNAWEKTVARDDEVAKWTKEHEKEPPPGNV